MQGPAESSPLGLPALSTNQSWISFLAGGYHRLVRVELRAEGADQEVQRLIEAEPAVFTPLSEYDDRTAKGLADPDN